MAKTLTTEEFITKARLIHSEKYDYSKVIYKNYDTCVEIYCNICKKYFWQKPNHHLNNRGCKICGEIVSLKKRTKTNEDFIREAILIHKNKYNYSKVEYINDKTKVIIICPNHGEFWQTPNNHLCGKGCKKCGTENTSYQQKFSVEEFIEKAQKIHKYKYNYSKVVYNGAFNKVIIICPIHGEFLQNPSKHFMNHGCPSCSESKGEKEIAKLLGSLNIKYERQKRFKGCKYKNTLPFDFYLPDYNVCIEYDGEQHFKPIRFGGTSKNSAKIQFDLNNIKDEIKNLYCKDNNIDLVRIRFDENIYDILSKNSKIKSVLGSKLI